MQTLTRNARRLRASLRVPNVKREKAGSASLKKWGNGQAVRIPKGVITKLGWSRDENVELITINDKLIISKVEEKVSTLQKLFEGYTDTYKPELVDFGEPIGKELL